MKEFGLIDGGYVLKHLAMRADFFQTQNPSLTTSNMDTDTHPLIR